MPDDPRLLSRDRLLALIATWRDESLPRSEREAARNEVVTARSRHVTLSGEDAA